MLVRRHLGEVEAEQGGEDDGDHAADEDLCFDRPEPAGGAADGDRVDVDDEDGARPRSRSRSIVILLPRLVSRAVSSTPESGSRRRAP